MRSNGAVAAGLLLFAAWTGAQTRPVPAPRGISEVERDTWSQAATVELAPVPEWAEQGRFTFMRMDGGPLEREKAKRSIYGRSFSPEESTILGDLYTTHADRMIALMKEAGVTWVWITWSNGWSREYEESQWAQLRPVIEKLHGAGIKVTAYLCATSIFWQNMFMDEPRSVTWLAFLPSSMAVPLGTPVDRPVYPYTPDWTPVSYGRRSTYRFIADVGNREWREYVKGRMGAALDAGVDAFFFDNALVGRPKREEAEGFFIEIQRFLKEVRRSPALLSTHIADWSPASARVNDHCELVFSQANEGGVIDGSWRSNIPAWRYQRHLAGEKPMYGEVIANFPPSGTTGVMSPKGEEIAMAEAAAAQFGLGNRVFGPFLKGIVRGEPQAMAAWSAIGRYNRFLIAHPELYLGARIVPDLLVVIPDRWPFADRAGVGALLHLLAQSSVQFEVCTVPRLTGQALEGRRAVVAAGVEEWSGNQLDLLDAFRRAGGKIYSIGGTASVAELAAARSSQLVLATVHRAAEARAEVSAKLAEILPLRGVRLETRGHVLATVTKAGPSGRPVIHVVNHDAEPQVNVGVALDLGFVPGPLAAGSMRVLSPDPGSDRAANVIVTATRVTLTRPKLQTYTIITTQ
jgi:hypothetical protein